MEREKKGEEGSCGYELVKISLGSCGYELVFLAGREPIMNEGRAPPVFVS